MSDQSTQGQNANAQGQGTGVTAVADNGATDATPAKLYATRAEAEAAKPADATKNHKVFEVAKNGATVGFIWARGYDNALALTARLDGYSSSTSNSAPVTKEAVAAKLATLSDDELPAMGLSRKPAKGRKN
jgi:hypothetical protein